MPNTQSNTDNDIALNKEITEDNKVIVICQSKKNVLDKCESLKSCPCAMLWPLLEHYNNASNTVPVSWQPVYPLPPATSSMSCKQTPCLHCPRITLWLSPSSSAIPWWIPGYLSLMIFCSLWILTHGGEKTTKSVSHDAKGILHHPSGMRQSVVKDPLIIRQSSGTKWLHQPGSQGEGIIPMRMYGISWSSPGSGSASGISKVPSTMPKHKSQSLKVWASELEPLVPTSTHRNLYWASTRARSMMEWKPL